MNFTGVAQIWKHLLIMLSWIFLEKTLPGMNSFLATISHSGIPVFHLLMPSFPYLKMRMHNTDSTHSTPNQLRYWRLNGDLPPEGTIAPNIKLTAKDTLEIGEPFNFELAFKNISPTAFDSIKVNMVLTDNNNVPHILTVPKKKPIQAGIQPSFHIRIDSKDYAGANTLFVNVNPDYDQPEQYLFNNFLFRNFYVKPDNYDPTLDVTFNGVRIF